MTGPQFYRVLSRFALLRSVTTVYRVSNTVAQSLRSIRNVPSPSLTTYSSMASSLLFFLSSFFVRKYYWISLEFFVSLAYFPIDLPSNSLHYPRHYEFTWGFRRQSNLKDFPVLSLNLSGISNMLKIEYKL